MSLRQNIKNILIIRVKGINLTQFKDLKFYIRQYDYEVELNGTASTSRPEYMTVVVPKDVALMLKNSEAECQVVITNSSTNEIRTHDPIRVKVGKLLWRAGYGS